MLQLTSILAGGAARATLRLNKALLEAGIQSRILTPAVPSSLSDSVVPVSLPTDLIERLIKFWKVSIDRRLRQRGKEQKTVEVAFSGTNSIYGSKMYHHFPTADIYHLHWVAEFIDYRILPRLQQRAPIVWTLHDLNPFTGGCHFAFGCNAYTSECSDCPQLSIQNHHPQIYAKRNWDQKRRIFKILDPRRIKFVAPSRWIKKEANRSALLRGFDTILIPNGVDHTLFHPTDKLEAKKHFGVPDDKTVIMLCAVSLDDKFKGISYALDAIKTLPPTDSFCVMTVGNGSVSRDFENRGVQVIDLGNIDDEKEMNGIYNAADMLVVSSIQDNLPNVVLEAMACALPVVAFTTGGIPDLIRHNETGLLVPTGDIPLLSESIQSLIENRDLRTRLGQQARIMIEKTFTLSKQASSVSKVYEELRHC